MTARRSELKLCVHEVARRANMDCERLDEFENGAPYVPATTDELQSISVALDWPVDGMTRALCGEQFETIIRTPGHSDREPNPLTRNEQFLIDKYRDLSTEDQTRVRDAVANVRPLSSRSVTDPDVDAVLLRALHDSDPSIPLPGVPVDVSTRMKDLYGSRAANVEALVRAVAELSPEDADLMR